MKKFFKSLALVTALSLSATSFAGTIEIDSDGDLEINVFANIIESFKVSITDADLQASGAPSAMGILDLNGGLAGYDALKSIAANACVDDSDVAPTFTGASTCNITVGTNSSASDSKLVFTAALDVLVEVSGTALIDLSVAMAGVTQGDAVFANPSVEFAGAQAASVQSLGDQDSETLSFSAEAPLNGGPAYDDTIVVTVTKQP